MTVPENSWHSKPDLTHALVRLSTERREVQQKGGQDFPLQKVFSLRFGPASEGALPVVVAAGGVRGAAVLHLAGLALPAALLALRRPGPVLLEVASAVVLGEVLLFHLLVGHFA